MHCQHCERLIPPESRFCLHCGKAVISPDSKQATRHDVSESADDVSAGHPALVTEQSGVMRDGTWGVKINTMDTWLNNGKVRPSDCPEWADNERYWETWCRRGVIVWDNALHAIERLSPSQAVQLLEELRATNVWREAGIAITEIAKIPALTTHPSPSKPKRARKSMKRPKPINPKVTGDTDAACKIHLIGPAAEEFYEILNANSELLTWMAKQDKQITDVFVKDVFPILVRAHRRDELNKVDLSRYKFAWIKREPTLSLVCEVPPDRATIQLCEDKVRWQAIIEQPGYSKHDWMWFLELAEAINWVEQTLPELRQQVKDIEEQSQREEEEERVRLAALPKKDLTAYLVDPSVFESENPSYRVIIQVEYVPYRYKEVEISFGEKRRRDEEFYPPSMIAQELHIPQSQVDVEQLTNSIGWYDIRSVASYYDRQVAIKQAQEMWDKSIAAQRFQEKKAIRVRYGYEEVETKYPYWIGVCEDPTRPWPRESTRSKYLEWRAFRETLIHALDLNGFREFLEIPTKHMTDEKLMETMHRQRSQSPYIPEEARLESSRWLFEHFTGAQK